MEIRVEGPALRVRTPAKLNLYLEVGPPRSDGFHDIDSIFHAISLWDELVVEPRSDGELVLEEKGIDVGDDNLVLRAARRLRAEAGDRASRGATIRLVKGIPFGAGLGGGSSDVAATLVVLDRFWGLESSVERLEAIGATIGSDVAFFFYGGLARCQGRGEIVKPIGDGALVPDWTYLLVAPRVEVSTPAVYRALDAMRPDAPALTASGVLDSLTATAIASGLARGELFFNRLENAASVVAPSLTEVRQVLESGPFLAVLMSGSGSSFFGVCRSADEAEASREKLAGELPEGCRVFVVRGVPAWRDQLFAQRGSPPSTP